MSTGNHYSKQVAALEAVLQSKLSQLSLLFEENKALRQRERALQAYQASLAGGLHATQKVLREASCSSYAALRAIGGCEQAAYDELYTTQLLRRATAQPEHTVATLAMSIPQRLAYVTKCVERFALLLPKYDRTGASTRSGPASQQTDRLVDELSEKALTFGLLDAPGVHLSECMINMETGLPEAYPDGWWDPVVEAMKLTDEQHAALKQHQQQQLRQVHLAAPVQRASSPSPQLQTSADAALQFRRSFLQPDAAAAAGWPAAAAPATPGAATSAAACTWLPASPNLATEEEGAAYQYDVIDAVLDGQLELEQVMLSREEVAAAVQRGAPDGCSSGAACQGLNSVIARSSSQCQRDLLMHVGSREQQQIEQEMDRITSQLKMQQYCLALHMHNVCSKKQIALHYLHCFPFIPEAFSCQSTPPTPAARIEFWAECRPIRHQVPAANAAVLMCI
ncbi:hypothetical protein COO60DRAFT_1629159 [Scenedesmus sp. NREL 46B-D3]|nr:hypothetical protein COO60DRAFT_1629159 [Scenedesmus sp. NREL 46B-D3]